MSDSAIIDNINRAFRTGCRFLVITSLRQDIGLKKCERGVELGYLRFVEVEIDDQETHWRYYWTDKAKKLFGVKAESE